MLAKLFAFLCREVFVPADSVGLTYSSLLQEQVR